MQLLSDWRQYRAFQRLTAAERNIVFYAESGQDWHHFQPLIDVLLNQHQRQVCYISSASDDPGLQFEHPQFKTFCISPSTVRIVLFQFLRADVLVLTMMGLDTSELKRSIHPVHYVYIFHSPGSTHMVDAADAYDHYDTLLCATPHQLREIRAREQYAHLPAKHLIEHGYHRIETLIEISHQRGPMVPGEPPTLLLAPTWGEQSTLNVCGEALLETLLDAGFNVILRPHYETRKRHPRIIERLQQRFGTHPQLRSIDRMGENDSLFDADLLITDWSAIALEYGLGVGRPVLFIDVPPRQRNPDYADLGLTPVEITIRGQIGDILTPTRIHDAPARIRTLLANPAGFSEHIERLRRQYLFNSRHSASIGAAAIANIADRRAAERQTGRHSA